MDATLRKNRKKRKEELTMWLALLFLASMLDPSMSTG